MKEFDFDKVEGKERREFYKNFWDKPITEEQFIVIIKSFPKKKKNNATRSPSRSRQNYRKLVKKFGFFQKDTSNKQREKPARP